MVGARIPKLTDIEARLAAWTSRASTAQWVSARRITSTRGRPKISPSGSRRETNRLVAEHVARLPIGSWAGLVPLQHPDRIVEYLDDAVLARGLAGVEISSFAGDVELSDERLEPFWARAAELGACLPAPVRVQPRRAARPVLPLQHRGQPTENAVALSHLIFAGVLDRHPDLRSSPRTAVDICPSRSDARTARGPCAPKRSAAPTSRRAI